MLQFLVRYLPIEYPKPCRHLLHLTFLLLAISASTASCAEEVTLAVAANFINAAKQLATEFEARSDHQVTIAVGSTGAHYAQINHGAPFDIFFAADVATPKRLEDEQRIVSGSRFTYARGQLTLWQSTAAREAGHGPTPAAPVQPALIRKVLTDTSFSHLAIANPRLAPYGLAAEQTLIHLGVLDTLKGKIVRGESVGQTFQFIHSGAATLGFVSLSQIIGLPRHARGNYWLVPQALYAPIEQQAVLLTEKKAAHAFLAFVRSDAGRKIIEAHGYSAAD